MARACAAEVEVINKAADLAERLRGAGMPDWYLKVLVAKLVTDAWLPFGIADEVAARSLALLRGYNDMQRHPLVAMRRPRSVEG